MNTTSRSLVTALLLIALRRPCPVQEKMDFHLRAFLKQRTRPDTEVDLFIHGDTDAVAAAVQAHGGRVKMSRERLVNARVPVGG